MGSNKGRRRKIRAAAEEEKEGGENHADWICFSQCILKDLWRYRYARGNEETKRRSGFFNEGG